MIMVINLPGFQRPFTQKAFILDVRNVMEDLLAGSAAIIDGDLSIAGEEQALRCPDDRINLANAAIESFKSLISSLDESSQLQ